MLSECTTPALCSQPGLRLLTPVHIQALSAQLIFLLLPLYPNRPPSCSSSDKWKQAKINLSYINHGDTAILAINFVFLILPSGEILVFARVSSFSLTTLNLSCVQ